MLAAERGSLSSSFGVQVAARGGCNEQDKNSRTGTSLPQHLLPQLRPRSQGSSQQHAHKGASLEQTAPATASRGGTAGVSRGAEG